LRDWQRAGVWQQLHHQLLDQLGRDGKLDWSRASLDSLSVRAKRGGELTGPNPTDRGKPGSKYHLLVDRSGIPLAVALSAANIHDSMLLEAVVDAIPAVKGPRGRPGRPRKLHLDKGTTTHAAARRCAAAGSRPGSPAAASSPASGWAATVYVVERSLAWLVGYRRLQVRYERRADVLLGFVHLACALVCLKSPHPPAW
jgi:transposase